MSMDQAQEQLQNALVTTFLANLAFLSEYDNALYQRVDGLSKLIELGEFKENYSLEFIMEDGDFDIYDIKNDSYLYNKKPSKFNRNAVAKSDFTSRGSFSIMESELFQGKKYFTFDEVEFFCNFDYSNKLIANDLSEYVEVFKNNLFDYKYKKYKYINKFMFIGTLLGRHIPLIVKRLKAKNYFVCEENLEIFRLSLFCVDYSVLGRDGNTVVFSIMEDTHIFDDHMQSFLTNMGHENYTIKYFTTDHNVSSYFDQIMNAILAHKGTTFNYHMMLENLWKYTSKRINCNNVLQMKYNIDDEMLGLPVLFLAAGPSLTDNIEWVKENKNKFLIVAVGATYKVLLKHGIKPHIITSLDPQYTQLNRKHFDVDSLKGVDDCIFICSLNTDERLVKRFKKENIFFYEMNKPLHTTNKCFKGYSVGEITASIIFGMGFKNIYLLGLDFAVNQKTGESHMNEYKRDDENYNINKKKDDFINNFTFDEELIPVKGNLRDTSLTTRLFAMSLNSMGLNIADSLRNTQKIYNLSTHGAFIEGTIPKKFEDVNKVIRTDRVIKKSSLIDGLKKLSKPSLSDEDYNSQVVELEYLKSVLDLLDELKENSSKDFDEFNKKIEHLILVIFFPQVYCSFLQVVFVHFFNVILQYVYYCLNTQKLQKEKKKIVEVEKVFLSQLKKHLEKYMEYLEVSINKK